MSGHGRETAAGRNRGRGHLLRAVVRRESIRDVSVRITYRNLRCVSFELPGIVEPFQLLCAPQFRVLAVVHDGAVLPHSPSRCIVVSRSCQAHVCDSLVQRIIVILNREMR